MNNFTFNNKHYLQKHGTAMGTKMAPSFANLFLAKFEHDALTNAPYLPRLRFLDDIFVIWTEDSDKLKVFVDYLNNLHPTIKFTCSHSLTNIPFLDVLVSLKDGLIQTDLYTINPLTNINIYLSPQATSPTINVPFHIALHFAFDAYAPTMTLTNNAERNLWTTLSIEVKNLSSLKPRYDVLPTFLVTPLLNPNLNNRQILFRSSLPIIPLYLTYSTGRCKNFFTNLPLVAYRRCKNISDILVRAKLPEPTLTPTNLGLHPARFGAIKLVEPSVLLLRIL